MTRLKRSRLFLIFFLLVLGGLVRYFFFPMGHPVQIYYPEKNALFLVPVTRWVKQVTPQALVDEIKKPPHESELLPALPNPDFLGNTVVRGNTFIVEFNGNPPLEKFPLLLKAILATMKQADQVDGVEFQMKGKPDAILNGLELGKLALASFKVNYNLDGKEPGMDFTGETRDATLYYLLKGTRLLVPVTQRVSTKVPLEEAITDALEGPPPFSWALSSVLPAGSHILSVSRPSENEIDVALQLGGSRRERALARKALILTYTQIPGIQSARLREKWKFWTGWWACKPPAVINKW